MVVVASVKTPEGHAAMQDGNTSLHVAAGQGDERVVRVLLEAGAKMELKNMNGETALERARKAMEVDVVALLEEWERGRISTQ